MIGFRAVFSVLGAGRQRRFSGGRGRAKGGGPLFAAFEPLGAPRWTARRYDRLADEAYRRNVIAFRCVNEVAGSAAAVPWLLYEGHGASRREHEAHPLLSLLRRPNPSSGGVAFMESVYAHLLIAGNAYIEAVTPDDRAFLDAPPKELHTLRPDRVSVLPGALGLPLGYRHEADGVRRDFPVDQVTGRGRLLHLKSFNPLDDWYGLSPIEAAAYSIDQHNEAGAWNQSLLQNGARPSGALVYGGADGAGMRLSDEQYERLKAEVEAQFQGARNAGRPLLLEGGLSWHEMALSPKDMDFINAKHTAARDIALAFGVPPMLLGIPGDNTYANLREARLALWEDTVIPLIRRVADALNAWLAPLYGEALRLDVDLDEVSALALRRERLWQRLAGADWLTREEKRAATGYAPMPQGTSSDTEATA